MLSHHGNSCLGRARGETYILCARARIIESQRWGETSARVFIHTCCVPISIIIRAEGLSLCCRALTWSRSDSRQSWCTRFDGGSRCVCVCLVWCAGAGCESSRARMTGYRDWPWRRTCWRCSSQGIDFRSRWWACRCNIIVVVGRHVGRNFEWWCENVFYKIKKKFVVKITGSRIEV